CLTATTLVTSLHHYSNAPTYHNSLPYNSLHLHSVMILNSISDTYYPIVIDAYP
ncbi:glucose-6-phosphate isomerase, partial [Skeletonema marinoi]